MDPVTEEILNALRGAYGQGGWLALAGVALTLLVRVFRHYGGEPHWVKLPLWAQRAAIFLLAAAGALLVAVATGSAWGLAVPGALVAGITAIITHKATQAVGSGISPAPMRPGLAQAIRDASIRVALNVKPPPPPTVVR